MIVYDKINDRFIENDALQYIRNNRNQENSRAVQLYFNSKAKQLEIYLNRKIFFKQKLDLSARKTNFQATNFETDYSSKKVFLTILREREKAKPLFDSLGRMRPQDYVQSVVTAGEPNYYSAYSKDFTSILNLCNPTS